ncbi:Suppressor of the cold-sensitive snRNP bioproteinsis mutant brr1-1 [Savitreella phatthalungensis]
MFWLAKVALLHQGALVAGNVGFMLSSNSGIDILRLLHPSVEQILVNTGWVEKRLYDVNIVAISSDCPQSVKAALEATRGLDVSQNDAVTMLGWQWDFDAPWHLARLNADDWDYDLPIDPTRSMYYIHDSEELGQGVDVHIIDTGVDKANSFFGGRAVPRGPGRRGRQLEDQDADGHGTAVAGLVGSAKHGVARGAKLVTFRCKVDERMPCTVFKVLEYMEAVWERRRRVALNHERTTAIEMMLLPFKVARNHALDMGVKRTIASIVPIVAPAEPVSANTCEVSPQRSDYSIVVGGLTRKDATIGGRRLARCVDVYAPAEMLLTTGIQPNANRYSRPNHDSELYVSGTSFSAAIVTGVLAVHLRRIVQDFRINRQNGVHRMVRQYLWNNLVLEGKITGAARYNSPSNRIIHYMPESFKQCWRDEHAHELFPEPLQDAVMQDITRPTGVCSPTNLIG